MARERASRIRNQVASEAPSPDRLVERGEDRHEGPEPLFGRDAEVAADRPVRPFREGRRGRVPVEDRPEGEGRDIRPSDREGRPDRVAVDAVGQEQRDGDVAHQGAPRRLDEQRAELLHQLIAAAAGRAPRPGPRRAGRTSASPKPRPGRPRAGARGELEDAREDRPGADDVAQRQVLVERGGVERAGDPGRPAGAQGMSRRRRGRAGVVIEEQISRRSGRGRARGAAPRDRELRRRTDPPADPGPRSPIAPPRAKEDLRVGARSKIPGPQPQLARAGP